MASLLTVNFQYAKKRIVILPHQKENPDIQKCYDSGANSYIVESVNFESFAQAIKNLGFYWLLLNQPPTP